MKEIESRSERRRIEALANEKGESLSLKELTPRSLVILTFSDGRMANLVIESTQGDYVTVTLGGDLLLDPEEEDISGVLVGGSMVGLSSMRKGAIMLDHNVLFSIPVDQKEKLEDRSYGVDPLLKARKFIPVISPIVEDVVVVDWSKDGES